MYLSVTLAMWLRCENRKVHLWVTDCLWAGQSETYLTVSSIDMHITKVNLRSTSKVRGPILSHRGPELRQRSWLCWDCQDDYKTTIISMALELRVPLA